MCAKDEREEPRAPYPYPNCPNCNAPPAKQEVRDINPVLRIGDVYCTVCGTYVREWDPS